MWDTFTVSLFGGFVKWWVYPTTMVVFLLKMIILGCEMGVPPSKETPIWLEALSVVDEVEILVEHLLGRIIVRRNCLPSWFRGGSWIARILSS